MEIIRPQQPEFQPGRPERVPVRVERPEEVMEQAGKEVVPSDEAAGDLLFPGDLGDYDQISSKRAAQQERANQSLSEMGNPVLLIEQSLLNPQLAGEAKTARLAVQVLNGLEGGITKP